MVTVLSTGVLDHRAFLQAQLVRQPVLRLVLPGQAGWGLPGLSLLDLEMWQGLSGLLPGGVVFSLPRTRSAGRPVVCSDIETHLCRRAGDQFSEPKPTAAPASNASGSAGSRVCHSPWSMPILWTHSADPQLLEVIGAWHALVL